MQDLHQLLLNFGPERARAEGFGPNSINRAYEIILDEACETAFNYSSFCLVALPHSRLDPDQTWQREEHTIRMVINPGVHPITGKRVGVPYGSRARMVMLYLQSEAMRKKSPFVELGKSMHAWLRKMGMSTGGQSYKDVREQAERIALASISFYDQKASTRVRFANESFIRGGELDFSNKGLSTDGWCEALQLSDAFYRELIAHAVPLREAAIRAISESSMAIDLYVWLAYRLHALSRPFDWQWPDIHRQFGFNYKHLHHFKQKFPGIMRAVLDVYPEANVVQTRHGFTLKPSLPPVPEQKSQFRIVKSD